MPFLRALTTQLQTIRAKWRTSETHSATTTRPRGSEATPCGYCHQTPSQNFKAMEFLYGFHVVDRMGTWWWIETRQCPRTGVILRETRRVAWVWWKDTCPPKDALRTS